MVLASNVLGGGKAGDYTEGARVTNSVDIVIASGIYTALTFDTERYDTDIIHNLASNTDRLTCNTAGVYVASFSGAFAFHATGNRYTGIELNGGTPIAVVRWETESAYVTYFTITTIYKLAVGDYLRAMVQQGSPGNLNISKIGNTSPEFSVQRIG